MYRNFCISGKDTSVECYKMEEIEIKLDLNRQKLVALGILLGCDYLPQGVSGVGKEIAMKLIKSVDHENLIHRFYEWRQGEDQDEILSSVEKLVKCKALKDKNFPHPEVIQEFLSPKVVPQQVSLKIFNPDLKGMQEFCLKHLQWPEEYTTEKVLLLITYWQMELSLEHHTKTLVQPERIVKSRVQQKIDCFEVEWQNLELGETCPVSFVTIETKELFTQAYPKVVEEFQESEAEKLSKKTKKKATTSVSSSDNHDNEMEFLSRQLEDLRVQSSMPQNESHSRGLYSDVSVNESLQDVIDSVLPTIDGYSLHHPPMINSASVNSGCSDSDADECHDDDDDNDVDDDDSIEECNVNFPWHSNSVQREFAPYTSNLDCGYGHGVDGSYGISNPLMLKDVQTTSPYHHLVDVSIKNNNTTDEKNSDVKTHEYLGKRREANTVQQESAIETLSDFKSRNRNDHGKKFNTCRSANIVRTLSGVTVLSKTDVIEIFGSSDEENDDIKSRSLKQLLSKSKAKTVKGRAGISKFKSRNEIPGSVTESSETKSPQKSVQCTNSDFSVQTDPLNFPEEDGFGTNECVPGILQELLSDHSMTFSSKDKVKYVNNTKRNKKELPEHTGKVLKPENNGFISTPHSLNQKFKTAASSDGFSDVYSTGGYEEVQGDKCGKENVNPPFDDYMPAPLSKRLVKQLSGGQRLASLRSISSVKDDIWN